MTVGESIKNRRKELGINADRLAEAIGVSRATMYRYENGDIEKVPGDVLSKIAKALLTTPHYLMGWVDSPDLPEPDNFPTDNIPSSVVTIAAELNDEGVEEWVDYGKYLLEKPEFRLAPGSRRVFKLSSAPKACKVIPLFGASFAAGIAEPDFGNAWEDYEIDADQNADFAIRIHGDSMEPYLADGSIALCVKRTPETGEVGAFLVDGEFVVKQAVVDALGNLYLLSLNRKRKDCDITIWHDSGRRVSCFGTIKMKRVPLAT